MRTLGEILDEAEKRQGLGQGRAAAMCGAHRGTYRAWKRGGQLPGLEHAAGIIRFTGAEPAEILRLLRLSESDIEALTTYAKGVWLSSPLSSAIVAA